VAARPARAGRRRVLAPSHARRARDGRRRVGEATGGAGGGGDGTSRRLPRLSDRPRVGHRLQHRDGEEPGRRPAHQRGLPGGPARSRGRPPRRGRPAAVPGAARAGRGAAGARSGAARGRQADAGALPGAAYPGGRLAAGARRPGLQVRPVRGSDQGRPGGDRQRPPAAHLCAHHRADQRPHRPAAHGRGQHRARQRSERRGGRHAAPADRRAVHDPGGQPPAGHEEADCRRGPEGGRLRSERSAPDRLRLAADRRQPDRSEHGDRAAEGGLPERRRRALPQSVRQRAPAARREARGDHRAGRRDPARPARHLRLPGEARPHGDGPASRRRAHGTHRRVDRVRGVRRRGARGGGCSSCDRSPPRC